MRVLVTGATGFIGYDLSQRLAEMGYDTYVLVRFTSTSRKLPDGVKAVTGDLTDYHSVEAAVRLVRPEIVFHLGAITPVSESFHQPVLYAETNYIGTVHLAEAVRKHSRESLKLFAFAGTTEMFDADVIGENTPFDVNSPYAVSKVAAHLYLRYLWKTYGFPAVTAVPTNTYGRAPVGQRHFVVEKIITEMLLGKKKILMGNPDAVRDLMFREDHVSAYLSLMKAVVERGREDLFGRYIPFGTGIGWRVGKVFEIVQKMLGWSGEVVWNAVVRPNEPKRIVVDPSAAERLIGWRPFYDLHAGLARAIEEWRKALSRS